MELRDKKVLVYGAGKSGIGAAALLSKVGAHAVVFDEKKSEEELKELLKDIPDTSVCFGTIPDEVISSLDLAVLSPGVPTDIGPVNALRDAGIPIWGEVELAWQTSKGHVLGITGTNGKTTTTSLLGEIMEKAGYHTFVVGNIGNAYTDAALATTEESVIVAELSSFQLETTCEFHPAVSAILNITPDHLNRHHTMEEYIRCKELITKNQTKEDVCVLNYEDEELRAFANACPADVFWFSSARRIENGIYLEGNNIVVTRGGTESVLLDVTDLNLLGVHNYENVMAAAAMALTYGVPMESIRKTCENFNPVAHRIEFSGEKNGVRWYNDSKGTNPDAAIKGIQAMNRPTLLIAGGYDKGSDYREWIRSFEGRVKWFVLEGKTKFDIRDAAVSVGFPEEKIVLLENMNEAMDFCRDHAEPGDAVLLSPACASWGEFPNYEVRGDKFKEYVREKA